nr:alpha tocopherol transfer protein [Hymenolepis microstoma]
MPKSSSKPYTLYDLTKPLSSTYVKRAEKELGEKSEQIAAHIESFRRWLKSMPHLKCNASDDLLLAFLRQAKYNHLRAQNRFDNFCTFRTSPTEGCPSWYENFKTRKGIYDKWIETK